ncbi:hypothetical protein L6452_41574 [Arctium lappa]|uniref:Uncharacterized protein n=1 Tax=Arctium lappa TaxID=4217 RepID=A0ACB8XQB6_ARCLA|nr:hypothetical protein L6452_41574 [Arctium lappa]
MAGAQFFNNISLFDRSGSNTGQFKVHSGCLLWKKQGGTKSVEVEMADIVRITWMKVPRSKLGVCRLRMSLHTNLMVSVIRTYLANMLSFNVGLKQAFEVSLADVSQTELQGKEDVLLEFHKADTNTTGANENTGQFKVHSGCLLWKKQGGTKFVEVEMADIVRITWMKVPRSNQLGVCRLRMSLHTNLMVSVISITREEKQLSVSGKNWGEFDISGNMFFFNVGSKQTFEVSLTNVSQTELQGKEDVVLKFHAADTTSANEVFQKNIESMAVVGIEGEETVATFEFVTILTEISHLQSQPLPLTLYYFGIPDKT